MSNMTKNEWIESIKGLIENPTEKRIALWAKSAAEVVPHQFTPMAIELGWLRAMNAMRDAVKAMPGEAIDRQELMAVIDRLTKNPKA